MMITFTPKEEEEEENVKEWKGFRPWSVAVMPRNSGVNSITTVLTVLGRDNTDNGL